MTSEAELQGVRSRASCRRTSRSWGSVGGGELELRLSVMSRSMACFVVTVELIS